MMHQKSEKGNGNTPPQKKDGKRIKIKVEINEVEMKTIQKAT